MQKRVKITKYESLQPDWSVHLKSTHQLRNGGNQSQLQHLISKMKPIRRFEREEDVTDKHVKIQSQLLLSRMQAALDGYDTCELATSSNFNTNSIEIQIKRKKQPINALESESDIAKLRSFRATLRQKIKQKKYKLPVVYKSLFVSHIQRAFTSSLICADVITILQILLRKKHLHQLQQEISTKLVNDLHNSLHLSSNKQQDIIILKTILMLTQASSFQSQNGSLFLENLILNYQTKLLSLIYREAFKINKLFRRQKLASELEQIDKLSQNESSDTLSQFTIVGVDQLESSKAESSWEHISEISLLEDDEFQKKETVLYQFMVTWIMHHSRGDFKLQTPVYQQTKHESPFDILTFNWIHFKEREDRLIVSYGNQQNYAFSDNASIVIYQLGQGQALVQWRKAEFEEYSARMIEQYHDPVNYLTTEQEQSVWSHKVRVHSSKTVRLRMRTTGLKLRLSVSKQVYTEIVQAPSKVPKEIELDTSSVLAVCEGE